MKDETLSDALLREFLLGNVDDEQRQRIESLFLTDPQARERVLAVEQDLIEDYLEDSLTTVDREKFLSRYAQTIEQQRKLRITRSIKDWAITEAASTQTVAAKTSGWSGPLAWLRMKPLVVVPVAVTAVIAIVVVAFWLSRREALAIERELAQLNSPASLRETPPGMKTIELSPPVRSGEHQQEIKKGPDTQTLELLLRWSRSERYRTYKVGVGPKDEDDLYSIPPQEDDGSGGIRIRLPVWMLDRGLYKIHLTGINRDGSPGLTEEYTFTVTE